MRVIIVTGSPGVGKTTLVGIINNHFQFDYAIDTDTLAYHSRREFLVDIKKLKALIRKTRKLAKVNTLYVIGISANIIDVIDKIKPDVSIWIYRSDEDIRFTLKERTNSKCLFWSNMKDLVDIKIRFKQFMSVINTTLSSRKLLKVNISKIGVESFLHTVVFEHNTNDFFDYEQFTNHMVANYDLGFPLSKARSSNHFKGPRHG